MKVRGLIFILSAMILHGCKKITEETDACFIPYVDFVAYNVNPNTLEVSFTSITSYNGNITSHRWDFGDGATFNGQTPPPHRYPPQNSSTTTNTYRVKYTVANECGEAYWTRDVKISRCLADVKFTYTFLNDSTVQFTNQTTSPTTVAYVWDFGDGTSSTSTASTITKSYPIDGQYRVMLKATNDCGENFYLANVKVCKAPIPSQTISQTGCGTVNINAAATRDGARYQWNFGNGVILPQTPSASPSISYTYSNSGTYNITLSVINATNCDTATITNAVTINAVNVIPNNNWTYTSDDLDFNFSREVVVNATAYTWNFGDGTTSSLQNPGNKTFSNPGVYNITLGAANNCSNHTFNSSINVPFYKRINNVPNTGFQDVVVLSATQIYYLATNGKLYRTDTAGAWSSAIDLPNRLNFNNDTRLFKDINNELWIYGRNEVAKFNTGSSAWSSSYNTTGLNNNRTIRSIAIDPSGNLWTIADERLRRNNTTIGNSDIEFSSVAFAPSTGRVWATASNRSNLYFFNGNSNQVNTVTLSGFVNDADGLKVYPNGELFFTVSSGIVRTSATGGLLNHFNAINTSLVLSGQPSRFDFDNEGNIWAVRSGRIIKIPIANSGSSKNYSINSDLSNISTIAVLNVAGNNNDLIIAKTATNGAIQVK
jgi:PKD repeat protein